MADIRDFQQTGARTGVAIDEGLRAYMLKVYNYMAAGLALTGIAAVVTYNMAVDAGNKLTPLGMALFNTPLKWVVLLAPIALVFFLSFRIHKMSVGTAQAVFWLYAALVGVGFSSLGLVYAHGSIAQVFLITAVTFGAVSIYGYTTKRDLQAWAHFCSWV